MTNEAWPGYLNHALLCQLVEVLLDCKYSAHPRPVQFSTSNRWKHYHYLTKVYQLRFIVPCTSSACVWYSSNENVTVWTASGPREYRSCDVSTVYSELLFLSSLINWSIMLAISRVFRWVTCLPIFSPLIRNTLPTHERMACSAIYCQF